jgi:uncharacterized protein YijF (DUF1287 family)
LGHLDGAKKDVEVTFKGDAYFDEMQVMSGEIFATSDASIDVFVRAHEEANAKQSNSMKIAGSFASGNEPDFKKRK